MLGLLLKNRLYTFAHAFWRGEQRGRTRRFFLALVWVVLLYVIFTGVHDFFSVVLQLSGTGPLLVDRILSMMFFVIFVMLLLSGTTVVLHFVFLSSDLRLLLSTPITRKEIFSYKFIESTCANSTMFLYFGLPVLIAYGFTTGATWSYYPFAFLLSLVFLTIPTGLAIVLALLAVRMVPANRAKDALTAIIALVFISVWAGLQFIRVAAFDHRSPEFDSNTVNRLQSLALEPFLNWIPSNIFAEGLAASAHGNWPGAISGLVVLTLISTIFYILSMRMIEGAYRRDLIGCEQLGVRFGSRAQKKPPQSVNTGYRRTNAIWGTIMRDFRLLTRDMRHISQLLIFAVMMVVFPVVMKRDALEWSGQWALYYPFFFVLLFEALAAGTIASKLVPLESKAFWLSKISPRPMRDNLWGKHFVSFGICTILGWIAVIITAFFNKCAFSMVLVILIAAAAVSFGISGLTIGVGAFFPKFDWDHPKRMLCGSGNLIVNLSVMVYIALSVGLFALGWLIEEFLWGAMFLTGLLGVLMMLIAAALLSYIGIQIAYRRFEKLEWFF